MYTHHCLVGEFSKGDWKEVGGGGWGGGVDKSEHSKGTVTQLCFRLSKCNMDLISVIPSRVLLIS